MAIRILEVVIPDKGVMLALAESYFDETNTHGGDQRLCVAGYIFEKENAARQAQLWKSMLEKWQLPYFHMVDCAHNIGVFDHLSAKACDLAARDAIKIIKDTASMGVAISVLESDFTEIIPNLKFYGSAYDACARHVMALVSQWIEGTKFTGRMHYFFESGVSSEKNASHCILDMMQNKEIKQQSRYAGHTFGDKPDHPGLQAADLLAWHVGTDCRRAVNGQPIRQDFESLTEIPHRAVHLSREMLAIFAAGISEALGGAKIDDVNAIETMLRQTRKPSKPYRQ